LLAVSTPEEVGMGVGGEEGREGEGGSQPFDESFELEDNSMSLGFSDDSSDDVIELLSEDEAEAVIKKGVESEGQSEAGASHMEKEKDSEIEQLKVGVL
jgi:hypothetical protein